MNRTDRLYALREELRRAGSLGRTAAQLAATFEVGIRTIKRDVAALQAGGFPVWARTGRRGGYVVDADATLPPVGLTPGEVCGLGVALAATPGLPYSAQARSALMKILAVTNAATRERTDRLAARVWIDHAGEGRPVDGSIRSTVEDALADKRVLSLHYRDADGTESRRLVDPQLLALTRGHWYLVAHCRSRRAVRWFRLDRIVAAGLTRQPSEDRPVEDVRTPPVTAQPTGPM